LKKAKVVDSMQIEMSNAAAKKEVVVVNQPANSTND
jgi:hypothetical protein